MDLHFYLWLLMSACAVALLIVNRRKQKCIDRLQCKIRWYRDEINNLKKLTADFTPMKSMADYSEKIQKFSEQAEDMFGLYIDTINLELGDSMFNRYWKIDMKTSGCKKPKEE